VRGKLPPLAAPGVIDCSRRGRGEDGSKPARLLDSRNLFVLAPTTPKVVCISSSCGRAWPNGQDGGPPRLWSCRAQLKYVARHPPPAAWKAATRSASEPYRGSACNCATSKARPEAAAQQ
jgi:hypothetical protein